MAHAAFEIFYHADFDLCSYDRLTPALRLDKFA